MAFQDFIKSLFFQKKLQVGYMARKPEAPYLSHDQNQADVSERFWDRSIYYYNAISKIAKVVAVTGFKIVARPDAPDDIEESGAAKKEKKMWQDFMMRPTKSFSEIFESLVYRTVCKILIHGQCGWELVQGTYPREENPHGKSFHCQLIDGFVVAKHDEFGELDEEAAFEQYFDQHVIPFKKEQVIFFRYPDPFKSWNGKSMIHLLSSQIAMEIQSEEYNLNFYKNSAVPSGIFTLPEFLLPESFLSAKQDLLQAYQGVNQAHSSAIVLSGQVTYTPIQSNPNDAQLDETRERIRDDIMVSMGAPPPVLGYAAKDGKVEVSEVDNTFLRYNIPFLQAIFAGQINMYCNEFLGYKYYMLQPKTADVVKNAAEVNALINEVQYGIITANEAREKLGDDPHPDGGKLLLPNTPVGPQQVSDVGSKMPGEKNDTENTKIQTKPMSAAPKKPPAPEPAAPSKSEIKAALEIWNIIKNMREENENGS